MNIINGDLLTINNEKYLVLENLDYQNKKYALVNQVSKTEEITQDYYIFEIIGDSIIIVENDKLKNLLIPQFEELLKKDINKIINE